MQKPNFITPKENYDPRWFIWTIVFLVVVGVSLVGYITLSGNSAEEPAATITHIDRSKAK